MSDRRATLHNSRAGKNGAYDPRHNDRSFLDENERPKENMTWHWLRETNPKLTFEESEHIFYETHFRSGLEKINDKYVKTRQKKRIKSMDDYRKSVRTCPEETLNYLGNVEQDQIDPDLFAKIIIEQIEWEQKMFPQVEYLNAAIHLDEAGAIHAQSRKVWIAHDEDGNEIVNQGKALEEMGVEIFTYQPDDEGYEKKHGKPRYENRKVTYTHMCRNHFIELAQSYGIELVTDTKDASEVGLTLPEYIKREEERKAKAKAKEIVDKAETEASKIKAEASSDVEYFNSKRDNAIQEMINAENKKQSLEGKITALMGTVSEKNKDIETLDEQIKAKKDELANMSVDQRADYLEKWLDAHPKVKAGFEASWEKKQINDARQKREEQTAEGEYEYEPNSLEW